MEEHPSYETGSVRDIQINDPVWVKTELKYEEFTDETFSADIPKTGCNKVNDVKNEDNTASEIKIESVDNASSGCIYIKEEVLQTDDNNCIKSDVECKSKSGTRSELDEAEGEHDGKSNTKASITDYKGLAPLNVNGDHSHNHKENRRLKPHKCKVCNFTAAAKSTLIKHERYHRNGKPRYICNICDFIASQKANLIMHLRTHSGDKPYKCNFCDYSANQQWNLVAHIRTHTGEKPFKCHLCKYRAAQKHRLTTHMRRHSGEKPYKCSFCDFGCSVEYNLIFHMEMHTGERTFKCTI